MGIVAVVERQEAWFSSRSARPASVSRPAGPSAEFLAGMPLGQQCCQQLLVLMAGMEGLVARRMALAHERSQRLYDGRMRGLVLVLDRNPVLADFPHPVQRSPEPAVRPPLEIIPEEHEQRVRNNGNVHPVPIGRQD